MKKNLLFVILFFIISCQKNNVDFKQFEISHTDGWKRSYSFVVFKDRFFEFNENSGERKGGKLNKNDFESLLLELSKLENSNLKSKTENCIDCSKTSINIDRNNKSFKIIQKAKIDSELSHIENIIEKIIKKQKIYFLKPVYFFKTEKDIMRPIYQKNQN